MTSRAQLKWHRSQMHFHNFQAPICPKLNRLWSTNLWKTCCECIFHSIVTNRTCDAALFGVPFKVHFSKTVWTHHSFHVLPLPDSGLILKHSCKQYFSPPFCQQSGSQYLEVTSHLKAAHLLSLQPLPLTPHRAIPTPPSITIREVFVRACMHACVCAHRYACIHVSASMCNSQQHWTHFKGYTGQTSDKW